LAGMLGRIVAEGQSQCLAPERGLLQVRALLLDFHQDGDVGGGILPEGEEVLIGAFCFGCVAVHCVGSAKLEMGERASKRAA